jgi:hypothetical protein
MDAATAVRITAANLAEDPAHYIHGRLVGGQDAQFACRPQPSPGFGLGLLCS